MPKMKTHRGAAKRFKRTGTGKFKFDRAYGSHLAANKTTKQKRQLRKAKVMTSGDYKRIKTLLAYKK
ncbi:50S ribosomal protein L35 [Ureibacillus thermophilus]|uniref:Large ribosomal subunit protein bL35 n=1 Tax=Ureibacillus thermophilus TaxID=367743 RepID=A0A4P6UVZ2_9BACL|nr:50S ribosomal protein L35 [Ureibacillus thermophilus]QBK26491.1 50S ribosomal protein L35 [Ureibacillus thermophilus]